ncbi:MAG: aminodeoxychorismate/anthranilate synthase component II [Desulfobulbaceae bacterium]|nr:MAG: aminodeoxychorismate/anthranilate synthase component II [Desulfobulbaceae bacterium]
MIVIIDNYDSFTYNIVQTIADNFTEDGIDEEMQVYRNDKISIEQLSAMNPRRILISPGPCTPAEAGISVDVIRTLAGQIPILGVCLGHQSIGEAFGGEVVRAGRIMHGKTSPISHDGQGVFTGIENPFEGMRYHSLVVEESNLPESLIVTARTDQGELMGLRHQSLPVEGVQFHPESIMTPAGKQLLRNFMSPTYLSMLGLESES